MVRILKDTQAMFSVGLGHESTCQRDGLVRNGYRPCFRIICFHIMCPDRELSAFQSGSDRTNNACRSLRCWYVADEDAFVQCERAVADAFVGEGLSAIE